MLASRIAFATAAAACGLAGCNASAQPTKPPPVAVQVAHAQRRTVATYDDLDGQVVPYLQSSLATQQAGTIVRVFANEGERVRAGDVLAQIDPAPLRAQLVQQQGNAEQARARLGQSRIQVPITSQQVQSALRQAEESLTQARQQQQTDRAALQNAKLVYQSDAQLLRQGFVAETGYEQARAQEVAAEQTLRIDTEKIVQAQAALEQARRNLLGTPLQERVVQENRGALTTASGQLQLTQTQLGETTLVAPFDGVVTQRLLDPGAYAGPNAPLFSLAQIDPIYVDFNVKEDDLAYVGPGTLVSFTTSARRGRRYEARVADVNAVPTTGTLEYRARLRLRNSDTSLRGGMLVTIRVTKQLHRDALVVPRAAVLQSGERADVFAVAVASPDPSASPEPSASPGPHYVARRVAVRLGLQTDTVIEVSSPKLHAGSAVVAARPDTLQDKTPVRLGR